MIVYHGSTMIVERPDVKHSYRPLDFGKGFYVTAVKEQAVRWARRKADIEKCDRAFISMYHMSSKTEGLKIKTFAEDLVEWIDFVCDCRDGNEGYLAYDLITGKVANDKVFRVVDMYHSQIWDRDRALKEIRFYPNYDQTAFVTQTAIDKLLSYDSYEEVIL